MNRAHLKTSNSSKYINFKKDFLECVQPYWYVCADVCKNVTGSGITHTHTHTHTPCPVTINRKPFISLILEWNQSVQLISQVHHYKPVYHEPKSTIMNQSVQVMNQGM